MPGTLVQRTAAHHRENGSGTVAVLGVLVAAALLAGVLTLGSALNAHVVRAQAVADLAALAAGDVSVVARWSAVGDGPCRQAALVAEENEMELYECAVSGTDTRVVIRHDVSLGPLDVPLTARARAGPDRTESDPAR